MNIILAKLTLCGIIEYSFHIILSNLWQIVHIWRHFFQRSTQERLEKVIMQMHFTLMQTLLLVKSHALLSVLSNIDIFLFLGAVQKGG